MEIRLLKRVPIFSQLCDDELEKIRKLCVTQHYQKDRLILIEEESGNTLFIIQRGRVKVSRVSDDGREVILSILEPGEFFGELSPDENKTILDVFSTDKIKSFPVIIPLLEDEEYPQDKYDALINYFERFDEDQMNKIFSKIEEVHGIDKCKELLKILKNNAFEQFSSLYDSYQLN